jgi:hypothetical protein
METYGRRLPRTPALDRPAPRSSIRNAARDRCRRVHRRRKQDANSGIRCCSMRRITTGLGSGSGATAESWLRSVCAGNVALFVAAGAGDFSREAVQAKAGVIRFNTLCPSVIPQVCGMQGNFPRKQRKPKATPADINQRVAIASGGVLDDCGLVLFRGCPGYITLDVIFTSPLRQRRRRCLREHCFICPTQWCRRAGALSKGELWVWPRLSGCVEAVRRNWVRAREGIGRRGRSSIADGGGAIERL